MTQQEIKAFLDRLAQFNAENADVRFDQFNQAFATLRTGVKTLSDVRTLAEEETAEHFNIFTVLDRERREVSTHSRFLAELLDPRGSHGQAHLFLRTFLDCCDRKITAGPFLALNGPVESFSWAVRTEQWVKLNDDNRSGRMDLVISSVDASFLLIIENKIDASESRDDQVASYLKWLDRQTQWKRPARKLVYLTVNGDYAQSAVDPGKYLCLSYRKDVPSWLKTVLPQVRAVRTLHLVSQYLEVVDKL
jgi:hypothetical protein